MLMYYEQCGSPFYLRLAKRKTQGEGTFPSTVSSSFFFFCLHTRAELQINGFHGTVSLIFYKQRGTISTHLLITSIKIIKFYYYYCYCCCCYCYAILYFQGPSSCGSHETCNKGARWAVRSLPRNCSWIN